MSCWECQSAIVSPEQEQGDQGRSAILAHISAVFDGEVDGVRVWPKPFKLTLLPTGMSTSEYIERFLQGERPGQLLTGSDQSPEPMNVSGGQGAFTASSNRCKSHGKPLQYSDEQGGRYCDHVDCWARYRLIRQGAALGYPELIGIVDRRTVADISKGPLYYIDVPGSSERLPVYPDRPPLTATLIEPGADAWRAYVAERAYQAIDQAIKALVVDRKEIKSA
jgi:hypothetical protein